MDCPSVPYNGLLKYEVWGLTRDGKHTVIGSIDVTHPKLLSYPTELRDERSASSREHKLIENCGGDQFQPPLRAFDRLVDSVELK
jgi:hypothetical protein